MPEERNALAELAERLTEIPASGLMSYERVTIRKAQRIIAELAKVPDCDSEGCPREDRSADAVIACRAIAAEEGAKE